MMLLLHFRTPKAFKSISKTKYLYSGSDYINLFHVTFYRHNLCHQIAKCCNCLVKEPLMNVYYEQFITILIVLLFMKSLTLASNSKLYAFKQLKKVTTLP